MKKILIFSLVLSLVFVASAFATPITAATSIGSSPFTPSKNVTVDVASQDSNNGARTSQYCAGSIHTQGRTAWGTCGGNATQEYNTKIGKKTCAGASCTTSDISGITVNTPPAGLTW